MTAPAVGSLQGLHHTNVPTATFSSSTHHLLIFEVAA